MSEFNMESLTKKIQEVALSTMGNLFPEDQLQKMVADAVQRFFEPTSVHQSGTFIDGGYYYSSNRSRTAVTTDIKASTFEVMVWNALAPKVQNAISQVLTSKKEEVDKMTDEVVHSDGIEKLTTDAVLGLAKSIAFMQSNLYIAHSVNALRAEVQQTFMQSGVTQGMLFNHR